VVAPFDAPLDAINEKIKKRGAWILKQRRYFQELPPKQPARQFVPGETHFFLGKPYRLKFESGDVEALRLEEPLMVVTGTREAPRIEAMIRDWYRQRVVLVLDELLTEWWPRMQIEGDLPSFQVRKMEKRWGSCTAKGAMLFNEELIKAPRSCIEYVVVHELCHLIEANHGPEFARLLEGHLGDWRERKARLEGQFS
jgi:predicted metal-dependent hydrolase